MKAKGLRPWKKVGKGVLLPMIKSKMRMSIILNLVMTATHLVQPLLLKGMLFYCSAAYYCTEEQAATPFRMVCRGGAVYPGNSTPEEAVLIPDDVSPATHYFDNETCQSCEMEWWSGWIWVAILGLNTMFGGFFKSCALPALADLPLALAFFAQAGGGFCAAAVSPLPPCLSTSCS